MLAGNSLILFLNANSEQNSTLVVINNFGILKQKKISVIVSAKTMYKIAVVSNRQYIGTLQEKCQKKGAVVV